MKKKNKRGRNTYVLVWGDDFWMLPIEVATEGAAMGMKTIATVNRIPKKIVFKPQVLAGSSEEQMCSTV